MARKAKKLDAEASNDNAGAGGYGRPAWSGHLRLSLVSCPVALINATSRSADVSFHLINPETNNRIRMVTTDPDTGPVERSDLVKGYEISKGEYVLITKDDLDSVKLETTRTLDIETFVDADTIDRVYWDSPYFLVPDGKEALDAYSVIHEAMMETNRMALGRLVMHTRERLMAIEPRGKGLMAYTLRMANEVKASEDAFAGIPQGKPSKQMIEIARKIIEQKEADFAPAEFVDRYETALKDLIEQKRKGHKPVRSAEPSDTNVIDLMAALKKSLSHGGARSSALKKQAPKSKRARA